MTLSSKGYSIVQKTHYLKWWRGSKERLAYWQGSCYPPNGFGVRLSILELHADFRILGLAQPTPCFDARTDSRPHATATHHRKVWALRGGSHTRSDGRACRSVEDFRDRQAPGAHGWHAESQPAGILCERDV